MGSVENNQEWLEVPSGLRDAIAAVSGHVISDGNLSAQAFPVSAQLKALRQQKQNLHRSDIGEMVEGEGVYLGRWEMESNQAAGLVKLFNVFAAPKDLTTKKTPMTYDEALQNAAVLKDWYGHDGRAFANDVALYEALNSGVYNGEWFIPPYELLSGETKDEKRLPCDGLYRNRDIGLFKGSFVAGEFNIGSWYMSCSEVFKSRNIKVFDFSGAGVGSIYKDIFPMSCRLVRVVEIKR